MTCDLECDSQDNMAKWLVRRFCEKLHHWMTEKRRRKKNFHRHETLKLITSVPVEYKGTRCLDL